jgi:hypothetical protein
VISLRVAGFAMCATLLHAADVALLIDVSGSMRGYGGWQPDAVTLVHGVLEGDTSTASHRWTQLGDPARLTVFTLKEGTLQIVRFGSTQSALYPFFEEIRGIPPSGLDAAFPTSPEIYRQARTNRSLAQAVGARLVRSAGAARMIIVSDFLIDADLTDAQQRFVNEFEAGSETETPLIYTWRDNQHVQVKLVNVRMTSTSPGSDVNPPIGSIGDIQLLGATVNRSGPLQFSWRLASVIPARYYQVVVRDSSNQIVFTRSRVLSESLAYPQPRTGRLTWRVTATLENDVQIASPAGIVDVPGTGAGQILMLVVAIAGAILLTLYMRRRRERKRVSASTVQRGPL